MKTTPQIAYGLSFILLLLCTAWLYWPGLHSIFILDDQPNLDPLSQITDTQPFMGMIKFATEGISGESGRPLSLLTFALQYHNWPSNPWSFKYVNLMLHLLNGCLIIWILLHLGRLLTLPASRYLPLALLTATLWLWHPFHASTVLYVVQRMVLLSAFFTLLGLLAYLQGRQYLVEKRLFKGYIWISLAIGVGGILATLSKENGILLVFYIVVLEMTVLQTLPKPAYFRLWQAVFIYLPIAALVTYLTWHFGKFLQTYEIRDFTLIERLLTEGRALSDYLAKILILRPHAFNLFSDDYPISQNLFTPLTTLFALIFLAGLLLIALWKPRTRPVLSFAILWFFAGHLLESTFLPLVPYFEHRNYLPMLGILFATVYGIFSLAEQMHHVFLRKVAIALMLLWFTFFPLLTWSQTTLWAQPILQAMFWAEKKPLSRFALSHAAALLEQAGRPTQAETYLRQMTQSFPNDTGPYMLWLHLACKHSEVTPPNVSQLLDHFQIAKLDTAVVSSLNILINDGDYRLCPTLLDSQTLDQLFQTLIKNPHADFYLSYLYHLHAIFHAHQQHYAQAVQAASESLAKRDQPELRVWQIEWLMADNRLQDAQTAIQTLRSHLNPLTAKLYTNRLDWLERQIKMLQEINNSGPVK